MTITDHEAGVWLITGCSAGFGRALTEAALAAGDMVVATARRPEKLASITVTTGDSGDSGDPAGVLCPMALDVTDPGAVDQVVQATIDRFGRIDVLVNNAGHGSVGAVEELTMDELRALFEVMFFGAVGLTKAVLPHMRARGTGTIVQISSMGGQLAMPGFGAYCSAKFALEGLSEALVDEVAPFGIGVVVVEPGSFHTEFGGERMHRSQVIDAYRVSTGATRDAVDDMDGTQPRRPGQGRPRHRPGRRRRPPAAAPGPGPRRGRGHPGQAHPAPPRPRHLGGPQPRHRPRPHPRRQRGRRLTRRPRRRGRSQGAM
jgi:NAD(P)-dependent dehydrogenase (short-subunit alcohol dehydrogenase family)